MRLSRNNRFFIAARPPEWLTLSVSVFAFTFSVHLLHIAFAQWGWDLLSPFPRSDAFYYHHKAWFSAFIDSSGGELDKIIPTSPYVLLLAAAYKIFGSYPVVPFFINALLMSASTVMLALTTRRIFSVKEAWIAGIIIGLCGPLLFFSGITFKTNLVLFFLSASVYTFVVYLHKPRLSLLFISVLLIGIACIERHNLVVVLLLIIVSSLFVHAQDAMRKDSIKSTVGLRVLTIMLAISLLGLITSWDVAKTEQAFFSPVGLNIYVGNTYNSTGTYTTVKGMRNDLVGHHTDAKVIAEKALGRQLDRSEVSDYWLQKSWEFIQTEPVRYIHLQLRKLEMLFAYAAPGAPEEYRVWRWTRPVLGLAVIDFGAILALALMGVYLSLGKRDTNGKTTSRDFSLIFLALSAALYTMTVWLFFIIERYRLPLIILLIPFAAYTVRFIWLKSITRRWSYVLVFIALYMTSFALSVINVTGPGWAKASDFKQVRLREQKRLNQLQGFYQQMFRLPSSERYSDWVQFSRSLFRYQLRDDAKFVIHRAIALQPQKSEAYWVLFRQLSLREDISGIRQLLNSLSRMQGHNDDEKSRMMALQRKIEGRLLNH